MGAGDGAGVGKNIVNGCFEMRALPTFSMSLMISSESPGPDLNPRIPWHP